ncbi:phosphotransferase family protein [Brevibacterium luteolum]|uniref:phosphotransferase family protein n=1 Tax=Brevibacterium luteolum TaxID=199591 RepID=UPI003B68590B
MVDTEQQPAARSGVPAGIDAERVGAWIAEHHGADPGRLSYEVMSVGRSNLTYTVRCDGEPRWVLRRPPLGHTGGSAHNVAREGRIMAALKDTDVPVVNVLDIVDDANVLDVPFVFMDHCPGFPLNTPADLARIPAGQRRQTAFNLVDSLAAIHRVDIDAVGLGDLRRPGGFVERQLRRWLGQYEAITTRDLPAIREVHAELVARMPDDSQAAVGLVHGDFKPNNAIFTPAGEIAAVVDWELSAIGEVVTDLGYLVAMLYSDPNLTHIWVPSVAEGFPEKSELIARYEESAGREAAHVDYYAGFALWKLACISEGVYTRILKGQMGDTGFDPEQAGQGVEELALAGLDLITGSR